MPTGLELRVVARRGDTIEATHLLHAAVVREGRLVQSWGEPSHVTLMRSAAKPLFALPFVRLWPDATAEQIAIASSSHGGDAATVEVVESLLAMADAEVEDLRCTAQADARMTHACSGSHASMLAIARARGWAFDGYIEAGHPVQLTLRETMQRAMGRELAIATDGCGVPSYAVTVEEAARAYGELASSTDASARAVAGAMREHPTRLGRATSPDVVVATAVPGLIGKYGREGLLCLGLPDGTGIAIKCVDGSDRPLAVAAGVVLDIAQLTAQAVYDDLGSEVGVITKG